MEKSGHQGGCEHNIWPTEVIPMNDVINEVGNVYGKLTVIGRVYPKRRFNRTRAAFKVRCSCGNEMNVSGNLLRKGTFKECGGCAQAWGKKDE
jgi:hypothetical protein